jgi:putative membrane protein
MRGFGTPYVRIATIGLRAVYGACNLGSVIGMKNVLARWAVTAVALYVALELNIGLSIRDDGVGSFLFASLMLALVNAVVRPVMVVLTLPLTFVTLGLFLLVVNALSLAVAVAVTPLELTGFGAALVASLVVTIIATVLSRLLLERPAG